MVASSRAVDIGFLFQALRVAESAGRAVVRTRQGVHSRGWGEELGRIDIMSIIIRILNLFFFLNLYVCLFGWLDFVCLF